jgi:hypothetical protein
MAKTLASREALHIRGLAEGICEVHAWDVVRLRKEFVPLLRARHGSGGLTVCTPCIERLKAFMDANGAKCR